MGTGPAAIEAEEIVNHDLENPLRRSQRWDPRSGHPTCSFLMLSNI
jgi:hypothetical protein